MAIKISDFMWRIVKCANQPGVQVWVAVLGENSKYSNVHWKKRQKEILSAKSAQQHFQFFIPIICSLYQCDLKIILKQICI